jgi:hypothetical protein
MKTPWLARIIGVLLLGGAAACVFSHGAGFGEYAIGTLLFVLAVFAFLQHQRKPVLTPREIRNAEGKDYRSLIEEQSETLKRLKDNNERDQIP